jgi:hypothetical protein
MAEWLTPPQIARQRGIRVGSVLLWIRRAELRAVNHAANPRGRPRWRVSTADLAAFDQARSNRAAVVTPLPRRRRPEAGLVHEYF